MSKERWRFWPRSGVIYKNHGGGRFLCTRADRDNGNFVNMETGKAFLAHKVHTYADGSIDWDYTTRRERKENKR